MKKKLKRQLKKLAGCHEGMSAKKIMRRRPSRSVFCRHILSISVFEGHVFAKWYMRKRNKELLDLWDIGFRWSGETYDLGTWAKRRNKIE
jgi:hypothetical protein